ncbi:MAG: phage protease [Planctomycetota bacterium]
MTRTSRVDWGGGLQLGPFVREQILSRLHEAIALAAEENDGGLERLSEVIDEIAERVDAACLVSELTGAATGPAPRACSPQHSCGAAPPCSVAPSVRRVPCGRSAAASPCVVAQARGAAEPEDSVRPASQLALSALATARGAPVREFLLIPFGEVEVERPVAGESFVFTPQHAESAKHWFDALGRKLAIDYEHQSFDRLNTRRDGLRPAAGWVGGLEIRDDGLWAVDVSWTERAAELLRTGEYRYFSPVIFWTDEDHTDVAALGPIALTNDPAMRGVPALAARRAPALDPEPRAQATGPDEPRARASGSDEGAAGLALGDAEEITSPAGPIEHTAPATAALAQRLAVAEEQLALLRRQLDEQAAEIFVERGLRTGKILESTRADWRDDYLRDPRATEQRLARSPVVLPPGRMLALDRRGRVAAFASQNSPAALSAPGTLTETNGDERADLSAYEQAAAAGRVRIAAN